MAAFNASSPPIKGFVIHDVSEFNTSKKDVCGGVVSNVYDHRPGHRAFKKAAAKRRGRQFTTFLPVRGLLYCQQSKRYADRDASGALNIGCAGAAEWLYGPLARPAHLTRKPRDSPSPGKYAVRGTWVLRLRPKA